jgi:hypothetical protein
MTVDQRVLTPHAAGLLEIMLTATFTLLLPLWRWACRVACCCVVHTFAGYGSYSIKPFSSSHSPPGCMSAGASAAAAIAATAQLDVQP